MLYKEYLRILYIDLGQEDFLYKERADLLPYLGGVGVATKLLAEHLDERGDGHKDSPIIIAKGELSTIFPVVTKAVAMFISPLTGELGESYAGGRLALGLLMAGVDALVITGKAEHLSYLAITEKEVKFKDARAFRGLTPDDTTRLIREKEYKDGEKRSVLAIGEGGEQEISFACVCVDNYRHFGRLGLGAIFGQKNLKGLTIAGNMDYPIEDFPAYFKLYQELYKKVDSTDVMKKYHDLGTAVNIEVLNELNGLPVKNLKESSVEDSGEIDGEAFARKNLVRKAACAGCPVGCIHIGEFRREFQEGYDYEAVRVSYDYELIFSLGSFLGINSTEEILEMIETVEKCGLDAISTGVVLGWATEAYQKGLITEEESLLSLEFGQSKNYLKAISYLSSRANKFYEALGQGAAEVSKLYGGQDFALTLGKNETAGYHTGYGAIVGATVGARHSHLCNGGYSFDQEKGKFDADQLISKLLDEEMERCVLNSLTICLFARKVYDTETILRALNLLGRKYSSESLQELGEKIYILKLQIKEKLGFKLLEQKIPKRFFETRSLSGHLKAEIAEELVQKYHQKLRELQKLHLTDS